MDMRITRGDLEPDLVVTCYDGTTPVDLTTATAITMVGVLDGSTLFRREVANSGADGVITLPWEAGDTDTAGELALEVEVVWPGNRPQTFPVGDKVVIVPDLG